jgi:outer membrane lipoprotein SlyB
MGDEKNGVKGAAEGIVAGATSGAIIGGIIATAVIGLVPGIGPALVAGALSGAFVGGLIGGEADSEEEPYFMQEVKSGRILVSVQVADEERGASAVLRDSAALEVDSLGPATLHARLHHPAAR